MSAQQARSLAVVGGGWAGLAAAVRAVQKGWHVSLFEMAPQLGGRARSATTGDWVLDNGQHILIGAYRDTLALMADIGVDMQQALRRLPLTLVDTAGVGLRLKDGHPVLSFAKGVMQASHWSLTQRAALLLTAGRWRLRGFDCDSAETVADITRHLPEKIKRDLIGPLCIAALNTPAEQASGRVFLRVLRDAVFGGRGAADLLLPQLPLGSMLAEPAKAWLEAAGGRVHLRSRVQSLTRGDAADTWLVDGERFDAVVLACTATEASRLAAPINEAWAAKASRVPYQSIVTVYTHHRDAQLAFPMAALEGSIEHPAQFVFDHGMLTGQRGLFAFVISGANEWLQRGLQATTEATLAQARQALPAAAWVNRLTVVSAMAERRATFACVPMLERPPQSVANHLLACGDYTEGPYPATLEGAVRSGLAAVLALDAQRMTDAKV